VKPELRLLTGGLSDDEYRSLFDTGAYLLRRDIGRPGWPTRWRRVFEGVAAFLVFVFVLGVLLGGCVLAAARLDALPR
jgi:hypothetical protein